MSNTTRPSVEFRSLTIVQGSAEHDMHQDLGEYRMRYNVCIHSDGTGVNRMFRFWDSVHNYRSGKRGLAGRDLLEAFWSFVKDAEAGILSFSEFCWDYGYDEDSISAHRTWKGCKDALTKYKSLWASVNDSNVHDHIASVLDELADMGVE